MKRVTIAVVLVLLLAAPAAWAQQKIGFVNMRTIFEQYSAKKEAEMIEEYRKLFASPYRAAERGFIDEIIMPEQTRPKLIRALESLKNKKDRMPAKKHDNLPL